MTRSCLRFVIISFKARQSISDSYKLWLDIYCNQSNPARSLVLRTTPFAFTALVQSAASLSNTVHTLYVAVTR
jgi:hypothetical protein